MHNFESYFSFDAIVKVLVRYRATEAKKLHDLYFTWRISSTEKSPLEEQDKRRDLFNSASERCIFPPRRQWKRPSKKRRGSRSSFAIAQEAILNTISTEVDRTKGKEDKPRWLSNLENFVEEVRNRAMAWNRHRLRYQAVIPMVKNEQKKTYRPLVIYDIQEKLIIGQCSKYLTDLFDPDFLGCSYAFRSASSGNAEGRLNHHQAVGDALEFMESRYPQPIWVAECDIKKFYDCVSHRVARKALSLAIDRLHGRGETIDDRAVKIFNSYLGSYSFNKDVWTKNQEQHYWKKMRAIGGQFEWAADEMAEMHGANSRSRIGVPQGGALSCLISNLVLDYADRIVLSASDRNLLYIRYCDDMILMHVERRACNAGFDRYLHALQKLKLAPHAAEEISGYGKGYWDNKASKRAYRFGQNARVRDDEGKIVGRRNNNVPWLSFVGYQIRYDGLVRVRPSSINKELKKQVQEADRVIQLISRHQKNRKKYGNLDKTVKQIVFRVTHRMVSFSVGRVPLNDVNTADNEFSWVGGFKLLKDAKLLRSQIKVLDRGRGKQINRVKRKVTAILGIVRTRKKKKKTWSDAEKGDLDFRKCEGPAYSYHRQFIGRRSKK